ncbi:MAG: TRAM domain-containing protein [Burkholderiales bacterium]
MDGVVHINNAAGLEAGDFVDVRIDDADEYDLYGSVV